MKKFIKRIMNNRWMVVALLFTIHYSLAKRLLSPRLAVSSNSRRSSVLARKQVRSRPSRVRVCQCAPA